MQRLLIAKRNFELERALKRLDHFDAVIIDDIGYVQQDREEMEVLFTFLAERYERRSVMITSNLVFSAWDKIFKDPMTTAAAIDRVVHHSTILELSGESYRAEAAQKRSAKRIPQEATTQETASRQSVRCAPPMGGASAYGRGKAKTPNQGFALARGPRHPHSNRGARVSVNYNKDGEV